MSDINQLKWNLLSRDDQYMLFQAMTAQAEACHELVAAIPGCPVHGQCVNRAIEWVRHAQGMDTPMRDDNWCCREVEAKQV